MRNTVLALAVSMLLATLARELADVIRDFDAWTAKQLGDLNAALARKQLAPVPLLTREQWAAGDVAAKG